MNHLKRVCENHQNNKMTLTNIAVCLSPCFFSMEDTEYSADHMKQATNVCKLMIKYVDILNVLPAEILRQTRKAREKLSELNYKKEMDRKSKKKLSENYGSQKSYFNPKKYFKQKSDDAISTYSVNNFPITKPTISKITMVPTSFKSPSSIRFVFLSALEEQPS